jgi:hypothetical protein
LEEFSRAIESTKTNSAGGMSGLTYNMMRCWSDATRKRVYDMLVSCWEEGVIPDYWKWRWLVPIPKKEDPELHELRPLMLLEALRKVWVSTISDKIKWHWGSHPTMDSAQHGFIKGRGTDSALLTTLNILETAKEWRSSLYMTSWDFKRAFDTVPKALLVHAWVRAGVNPRAAEYMVSMDEGPYTVVRSPLALSRCGLSHHPGELADLAFQPECGTSQGDVQSPLNWVAVYDILLYALRRVGERNEAGRFYTQSRDMVNRWVGESSFADDLVSFAGTREHLQDKADVVSAFAVICGMTLSAEKFRGFALHWGNASKSG